MQNTYIKRIQIPTHIIRNSLISSNAIYLYIILKTMTSSLKVVAYSSTILERTLWTDRRTLKKYLQELKHNSLISYDFDKFPINKPLLLNITPIEKEEHFTQVDVDTIQKIISATNDVLVNNKPQDLKETAIRLFYLYESYYNTNYDIAYPSYTVINKETRIKHQTIKILNDVFHANGIVKVNYGEKSEWNRNKNNTYVPICNRV